MYNRLGFFSYKRGANADDWYERTKDLIESYIRAGVGAYNYSLFFDRTSIPSGSYWENRLREGLDKSPILIAFFSQAYFQSEYCCAELRTFIQREDQLELERGTLIQAASVTDVEYFPDWARMIQVDDFQKHYLLLPTFWESQSGLDYDRALKAFAERSVRRIANIHAAGADYRADFPKLAPRPIDVDTSPLRIFGPAADVRQPFGRRAPE